MPAPETLPSSSASTTTWCRCAPELLTIIPEAFSLAESGRPGPVAIDVPKQSSIEHLDWPESEHHDATMRTTVTLDKDAERLLRNAMHSRRKSFKETLNDAIRAGLGAQPAPRERMPFVIKARPMGLCPGIDPASLNKLADELEAEAVTARAVGGSRK